MIPIWLPITLIMLCSFLFLVWKYYSITIINPRSQFLGQEREYILRHYLFGDKIIQNCLKTDATISMIIIYFWDKKLKKKISFPGIWYNSNEKDTNLTFLAQKMHFSLNVFRMTVIALVSVMNHYHTNGLHLFWDTLYILWEIRYLMGIFHNY